MYEISLPQANHPLIGIIGDNKDASSRVRQFVAWMEHEGFAWFSPDLEAYRDRLLEAGMAPSSVAAHLSTIRGAYKRLMRHNPTRDLLYAMTSADDPPERRKAIIDEMMVRLQNAVHPDTAHVKVIRHQDTADAAHVRLTREQAELLLAAPGVTSIQGLRDTAVIALLLCTGLREAELCGLEVDDLRQSYGGALALRVRRGKGSKARLVPYGDLDWCLEIVEAWMRRAGISDGPAFRGLYRHGLKVRPGRLSVRAVEYILATYPIEINGQLRPITPHDCRRTYARRLFEAGVDLVAIQQNLGHTDTKTTLRYIGALDADRRRARGVYGFDLSALGSP
jgi:site-specific recombinase XerD